MTTFTTEDRIAMQVGMNANELSLQLGFYAGTYDGDFGRCLENSSTMLRQQQEKIKRLSKALLSIVEMNPELPMGVIEEAQEAIYEATGEKV